MSLDLSEDDVIKHNAVFFYMCSFSTLICMCSNLQIQTVFTEGDGDKQFPKTKNKIISLVYKIF